ncbi:MAG: hypothetical protein R3345_00835 [Fulvivirga sp.]|nr:hypothetical protein [Fulvivirga sp.]
MRCSTGKICFDSQSIAEEALLQNHAKNNYAAGQGPVNVYLCDRCGCYHFTSKGEVNALLEKEKHRIDRLRQANYWEEKFRR